MKIWSLLKRSVLKDSKSISAKTDTFLLLKPLKQP